MKTISSKKITSSNHGDILIVMDTPAGRRSGIAREVSSSARKGFQKNWPWRHDGVPVIAWYVFGQVAGPKGKLP